MSSIKLIFSLIYLLLVSHVLAKSFIKVESQSPPKEPTLLSGGKDCPPGAPTHPEGKDYPPEAQSGCKDCPPSPGGKHCPPAYPGGKECPCEAHPGGKHCPPREPPHHGGKDCPPGEPPHHGGKDCPPGEPPHHGGKDCPPGEPPHHGGKDCPSKLQSLPGGTDCPPGAHPGGKDCPPGGHPGGKYCPAGAHPGGKDCPPGAHPGGKQCPVESSVPLSPGSKIVVPIADPREAGFYDPPLYGQVPLDTHYKGEWIIHNKNVGVNAMHFQLLSNNKAVWTDTTNFGPSSKELGPKGNCPHNPETKNEPDCYAHGLEYDVDTGEVVTVYVKTDPWCSSGHVLPNGDLVSTGGNRLGGRSVRLFSLTEPGVKFVEREKILGVGRWYSSNCVLEDGSAVIVGGRDAFSYDIMPPHFNFRTTKIKLPFLKQTTEPAVGKGLYVENNLYPFTFLIPDGNVFIFANDRAIRFNPKTGATVQEYPVLQGGSRNYPTSGQAALLPLRLSPDNSKPIPVEVVVCGGNKKDAYQNVDAAFTKNRVFFPALSDCNRIKVLSENPVWEKDQDMPSPRTMGDLLLLPNGQLLFINGAKKGTSGWEDAEDPNLTPALFLPENSMGARFKELNPTTIPRMYHSISSVLPDGKILVAGSNAHQFYTFKGPYPTELRVEKFSPHYLDPKLSRERPVIKEDATDKVLKYGKKFKVTFTLKTNKNLGYGDVLLTLLYPPFTTHGFSQNQRLLITGVESIEKNVITAVGPPSGKIAPPGYYLMFVTNLNVPSKGIWVHID